MQSRGMMKLMLKIENISQYQWLKLIKQMIFVYDHGLFISYELAFKNLKFNLFVISKSKMLFFLF